MQSTRYIGKGLRGVRYFQTFSLLMQNIKTDCGETLLIFLKTNDIAAVITACRLDSIKKTKSSSEKT